MNKNTILNSFLSLVIISLTTPAYAQKTTDIGKTGGPTRTDVTTSTSVTVPGDTSTGTTTGTSTGTTHTSGTSTGSTTGSTTDTGTSVQGTNTTPTNLGNTTQVGGVNTTNNNQGGGKGGKGKKNKKGKQLNTPNPADQTNVTVPAVGGNTTTQNTVPTTTNNPIMIKNDGPFVTTPITNGTEVNLPPSDWTKPIGSDASSSGTTTSTSTTTTENGNGSPNVTGSQTVQNDGTSGKSCDDLAIQEVYKVLSSDQSNAFAKMVELTTMKLARKALAEGSATLEGYTRTKIKDMEGYFKQSKEAGAVRDKIVAAYSSFGKAADAASINKDLDAALARGQKACYWAGSTDLWNNHVASYILAMSAADASSGLTDADAATVWALEKVRVASKGGGTLKMTNRVARYLGAIQGGKASTKEDLDAAIAAQEKELNDLVSAARTQTEKNLVACIEQQNPSCTECQTKAKANLFSATSSLEQVQRGLAAAVNKAEAVSMVSKFKGKAGDIDFSLDNFAKGSVQKDPSRLKGFDACGQPKTTTTAANTGKTVGNAGVNGVVDQAGGTGGSNSYANNWLTPKYNIAPADATYVDMKGPLLYSQGASFGTSKTSAIAAAYAKVTDPQICKKYHGCVYSGKVPMCQVCPKTTSTDKSAKGKSSDYKLSVKTPVSLDVLGTKIPLVYTTSLVDPKKHPTLYTVDHLSPLPFGSMYKLQKDAINYGMDQVTYGANQVKKSVQRNPGTAGKMYLKSVTGWYYSPLGWYDLYDDLTDLVK